MPHLTENHYGKSRVRLMKVTRAGDQHEVREWNVGLYLEGDFARCFTDGDNTGIMATDTMKNTVYSVARESTATTVEGYAQDLARLVLERNPQVARIRITVEEKMWIRLKADGQKHGRRPSCSAAPTSPPPSSPSLPAAARSSAPASKASSSSRPRTPPSGASSATPGPPFPRPTTASSAPRPPSSGPTPRSPQTSPPPAPT